MLRPGMGRAPGLALAYMLWCRGFQLQDAYAQLFAVRRCHPKLSAIREATCDILYSPDKSPVTIRVPVTMAGGAKHIQVSWLMVLVRIFSLTGSCTYGSHPLCTSEVAPR